MSHRARAVWMNREDRQQWWRRRIEGWHEGLVEERNNTDRKVREQLEMKTKREAEKKQFVNWKREALDSAADAALDSFKKLRPKAITMRDIYAGAVVDSEAAAWIGQDYEDYLNKYDYTVVMAYPYMDKEDPQEYLQEIAQVVKDKGGVNKTIVKVQSYDWDKEAWLDGTSFAKQLRILKRSGMKNMGYYPATFCYWEK